MHSLHCFCSFINSILFHSSRFFSVLPFMQNLNCLFALVITDVFVAAVCQFCPESGRLLSSVVVVVFILSVDAVILWRHTWACRSHWVSVCLSAVLFNCSGFIWRVWRLAQMFVVWIPFANSSLIASFLCSSYTSFMCHRMEQKKRRHLKHLS